jgi:hypothetical protein
LWNRQDYVVLIPLPGSWEDVMTMFLAGVAATFGICTLWLLVALMRAPTLCEDGVIRLVNDDTV